MKITELKKKALDSCKNNWVILVMATILMHVISLGVVSGGEIGGSFIMFFIFPLIYFTYVKCLMLKRNNKIGVKLREVNITLGMAWNYIKFNLWLLLFTSPSIVAIVVITYLKIKGHFYIILYCLVIIISVIYLCWITLVHTLTIYVIAENNGCNSALKLMKEARSLIKGNIIKYILLKLSFIGWGLLSFITFYVGTLWLVPYMELTKIEFYYSLKDNN